MKFMGIVALFVVTLALWPVPGNAAQGWAPGYACSGCSFGQYRHTAIAHGLGDHLVYDFQNDQLNYYKVTREMYGYGGGWLYQTTSLPVPIDLQTWFERARATWAMNGKSHLSLEAVVKIKVGDLKNLPSRDRGLGAYDVVKTPSAQADFVDTLDSGNFTAGSQLAIQNIVGLLQAAGGIVLNDNATQITIDVVLDDGSELKFVWRNGQDRPQFVAAWDANNNPIALQPADVQVGIYSFERYHPDRQGFVDLMHMYNIPVTFGQSAWIISCVQVGEGKKVCSTSVR